ncbi:CHASE2 domain-containing protein [Marinoscillum sp.]|uniref:CHASE2 domain-containing protein n=1 Tax=Marinoscillum sp. TaxID=2024838 RepID=UPI003BA8BF48
MRKFLLDTVLCSLFIFGIMGLFSSVTYFKIFDLFDPIGDMFADFEMSDLVMSKLRDAPPASEDIVVVNIAHANREEIGYMIQILEKYQPSVIGVDVTFASPKPYAEDSVFEQTLAMYDNVVIGSELRLPVLETEHVNYGFDTLVVPEERLAQHADFGFVNLLTNAENQEDVKFCRELVLRARIRNMEEEQLAFAVKLAQYKDPEATQVFLNRGNVIETVNYKGNVIGAQSTLGTRYFALDIHEVFNEAFTPDLLKDKVVIMCFLGAYIGDLNTRQDLYFTPLNKNYVGKAEPDMFGGVIHANTVSMILEGDYIDSMSQNTGIVLAILTCLVIVFCFKWVYGALPKWYDGITKIVQLVLVIGISILMMVLFNWYNYKAELSLVIIVIALSGDSIEVYHGVVKNLFSKRERAQLFKINRKFWKE